MKKCILIGIAAPWLSRVLLLRSSSGRDTVQPREEIIRCLHRPDHFLLTPLISNKSHQRSRLPSLDIHFSQVLICYCRADYSSLHRHLPVLLLLCKAPNNTTTAVIILYDILSSTVYSEETASSVSPKVHGKNSPLTTNYFSVYIIYFATANELSPFTE